MDLTELTDRLQNYNFFSYIFLTLPNNEFVNKIFRITFDQELGDEVGVKYIESYIKLSSIKTLPTVLKELLIDRTQLLRGISEKGCPPPYESLYVQRPPQEVIGDLISLYNQAKYCLVDNVNESREYVGVELNFMSMLCEKQLEALESNDVSTAENMRLLQVQFFNEHLSRWIPDFAREMHKASNTEFYKGIALMLEDWVQKEAVYLSQQRPLLISQKVCM